MSQFLEVGTYDETLPDGTVVERFETDTRESLASDNVTRRMMSPNDCLSSLIRKADSRQDLLAEGAGGVGLQIDPHSLSGFSIEPRHEGEQEGLAAYCQQHGPIPLTEKARGQLASLMGAKGGFKRYTEMGDNGSNLFVADFNSMFNRKRADKFNLVFRTILSDNGRVVEGVMKDNVDRTDSVRFVAHAMQSIINRYSDCIRGVEVFNSSSQGGMEFRILFGNPFMRESETQVTKRMYAMLRLSTSDIRAFAPSASLGVWRMWCSNGCTEQLFDGASFRMNQSHGFEDMAASLDSMASIAFPYAGLIGHSLSRLQHENLGGSNNLSMQNFFGILRDRGHMGEAFYEVCHDAVDDYPRDEQHSEWDAFNVMTDAAKRLGSMAARRNAESKALQYAMYEGGLTAVADHGFNQAAFERDLASRVKLFVEPNRVDPRLN